MHIQQELKAPKGRNNRFGGYYYRSTEDILTALKPLLNKYKVILTISDEMELIGERYYVKATSWLEDTETGTGIGVSAYARETFERKKSDDSQLTGAASSYARKYALNGMFLIDDTQDADTYEDMPAPEVAAAVEEKPVRKTRKRAEVAEVDKGTGTIIGDDKDRYFFNEEEDNVKLIRAGEEVPEGWVEINEEQYKAARTAIATGKKTAKRAIENADLPFDPDPEPEEEEVKKPRTRRTRRTR